MSVAETVIAAASAAAAVGSAIWAYRSAALAQQQLALLNRRIGMITDPSKMAEVLPTWYIDRMSQDNWGFGLLLSSGDVLAINRIVALSDDGKWLEVELDDGSFSPKSFAGLTVVTGLTDRPKATVKVDQIQAAFELTTS